MRILYDGWPLVHTPLSAAAAHLHTLLTHTPAGMEPLLALPAATVPSDLPPGAQALLSVPKDRGEWEQRTLPQLSAAHTASCIHTTASSAALFGKVPTLVSPAEPGAGGRGRLAAAQALGGLARATLLWPQDLPQPAHAGQIALLPPVAELPASPAALPADTPEEYLLYHGSGEQEVLLGLLESWTWAAASIGELYPLLIAGLDVARADWLRSKLPEFHLEDFVRSIPAAPEQIPALIDGCSAFVHPEPPPAWGSSLRLALAYGKAVVGLQEPLTEAMTGSAAYLVAPGDLRSLGAATITVVVDESVRVSLEAQAKQKGARWETGAFIKALGDVYESIA